VSSGKRVTRFARNYDRKYLKLLRSIFSNGGFETGPRRRIVCGVACRVSGPDGLLAIAETDRHTTAQAIDLAGRAGARIVFVHVIDWLAERAPSLILLDLMMPVMDGFEFVMEMHKLDSSSAIPIVVVTAKDITEEDRRRLNGDVVGLIEKGGLDRESLLTKLREQVAATWTRDT